MFSKFTGAHTQHIERVWREVRGNIPRYGRRSHHVIGYLAEFLFKRAYSRLERLEIFFDIIAEVYPPPLTLEIQPEGSCDEPSTSTASRHVSRVHSLALRTVFYIYTIMFP